LNPKQLILLPPNIFEDLNERQKNKIFDLLDESGWVVGNEEDRTTITSKDALLERGIEKMVV
jgi:hypothetical protein